MTDKFDELCKNCELSYGSHHGGKFPVPYNSCPGHEGRMDWKNGPGTTFLSTGIYKKVPFNTPCKQLRENEKRKESENLANPDNAKEG